MIADGPLTPPASSPSDFLSWALALALGAVVLLFGLLIRSKSSEAKAWKAAFKGVVVDRRRIRRDVETATLGAPSIPPVDDSEYDDQTARINAIDREDRHWRPPTRIDPAPLRRPATEALESKRRLPAGAGHADYDDHRRRNAQEGYDTPTQVDPPKRRG